MKVGFTNINAKAEGIEGKPAFAKHSAAALPGAGLVCHRWSRPWGMKLVVLCCRAVVGTEVGRVAGP
jgi:hypothetical protein